MPFELTDDGTLDTVVRCTKCGREYRYTYDPETGETYDEFVDWALEDALDEHECEEDETI